MRVEWHGQSAFTLTGPEGTVLIDPFGDIGPARERGLRFDYPPIEVSEVDLVLVTHEHLDHNGVEAIGAVDLLFLPVGGGPTIGGAAIVERLHPRWVVPMHYRTHRTDFLEGESEFVDAIGRVERLEAAGFNTADLPADGSPLAVVPAAP